MAVAQAKVAAYRRESQAERFDRIYREIRQRICLLECQPGMLLNEGLLAEEFGVSRTPVRNVLMRLRYEGLVETRNGVGTIVSEVDIKTFKDIYELRMRLAEMMGDLAAINPDITTIQALKNLRDRVETLVEAPRDLKTYARLCNELHELIIAQIGNSALREITDLLYYRSARTWLSYLGNLEWQEEVQILHHECSEILLAMELGDVRGVGNARRQFLYMTLTRISRYLVNG